MSRGGNTVVQKLNFVFLGLLHFKLCFKAAKMLAVLFS